MAHGSAGRGTSRRGAAGLGVTRQGEARRRHDAVMGLHHGSMWRGSAWRGKAWLGRARFGWARFGWVRQGAVGQGAFAKGDDMFGMKHQYVTSHTPRGPPCGNGPARQCWVWHGPVRQGVARLGAARQGWARHGRAGQEQGKARTKGGGQVADRQTVDTKRS